MADFASEYAALAIKADYLRQTIERELAQLLARNEIPLGVPMESRVKERASVEEKLTRKQTTLTAIDDLVGVRAILLFRADLEPVEKLLKENFDIVSSEDTAGRLTDNQFGYQSMHYIVRLPKSWLATPSMAELGDMRAEIQVRTLAQHVWAAASHKLQYKQEASVPPPIRRTINRISALLETVDMEFDRVRAKRSHYKETKASNATDSDALNVDNLAVVLKRAFLLNYSGRENYAELLQSLNEAGISKVGLLRAVLNEQGTFALLDEKRIRETHNFTGTQFFNLAELAGIAIRRAGFHFPREATQRIE